MTHSMSEYCQPQPKIVTPVKAIKEATPAPSDAIILFDGINLAEWENRNCEHTGWTVHDGVITVKKGIGDI